MIVLDIAEDPKTPAFGPLCTAREAAFSQDADGSCLKLLYATIGCETVDVIDIGHNIDMWVDDEGAFAEDIKVNWLATMLRTAHWAKSGGEIAVPSKYPPIFGRAVLLSHDIEGRTLDLSPEQVEYVKSLMDVAPAAQEGGEA